MNWKELPNVQVTSDPHVYDGRSPVNVAWNEYVKSGRKPLQWVADKFGKNRCWKVMKAKWDLEKKSLKFTLLVNADVSREVDVPYEEICKEMNWKSFSLLGEASCVPVEMTIDEVSALYKDAVAKTLVKDKQWLKEHPEALTKLEKEKSKKEGAK